MAQLPCIGLYKPCINPPFGDCAMYFDHGVTGMILQAKTPKILDPKMSTSTWRVRMSQSLVFQAAEDKGGMGT